MCTLLTLPTTWKRKKSTLDAFPMFGNIFERFQNMDEVERNIIKLPIVFAFV